MDHYDNDTFTVALELAVMLVGGDLGDVFYDRLHVELATDIKISILRGAFLAELKESGMEDVEQWGCQVFDKYTSPGSGIYRWALRGA